MSVTCNDELDYKKNKQKDQKEEEPNREEERKRSSRIEKKEEKKNERGRDSPLLWVGCLRSRSSVLR